MKDNEFMGIIKIIFKTDDDLNQAIQNKLSIFRQKYIVETFQPKPRVIRCMRCQRFGHVARVCREKNPICGKCTSTTHETKNCAELEENYKCHHCHGNHATGDKECPQMIEKLDELIKRR